MDRGGTGGGRLWRYCEVEESAPNRNLRPALEPAWSPANAKHDFILNPEHLLKNGPQLKNNHVGSPQIRFICVFKIAALSSRY